MTLNVAGITDVQTAAHALSRLPAEPEEAMSQLQRLCLAHRLGGGV